MAANKKYEIRGFDRLSEHIYDRKVSCVLYVEASNESQLMTFKSKLRQKIRKAEKNNFLVAHGGLELLDDYYLIYAQKMLQFGSPPIGKVFFKNLLEDYTFGNAVAYTLVNGHVAYDRGQLNDSQLGMRLRFLKSD